MILQIPADVVLDAALRVIGLALLAGALVASIAFTYRWYADDILPDGVGVLVGIGAVATWLNTRAALGEAIGGSRDVFAPSAMAVTVAALVTAGIAADAGRRIGDRIGDDLTTVADFRAVDTDLTRLVRGRGRVVRVTMPETVGDIDGYDPVPAETKAAIAGRTFVFPAGLTVGALRDRLVARLRDDHGVAHADVDLAEDGSVEYLAVGTRAAGLGPTLDPDTVAVAARADPAFSATPGDLVQLWSDGDEPKRLVTGELRFAVEDIATVAVDRSAVDELGAEGPYRVVTLPAEPRPDREFATLLRAADETMTVVEIDENGPLVGAELGSIPATVVAVRTPEGEIDPIPERTRTFAAGESIYAIGRPEALRRIDPGA